MKKIILLTLIILNVPFEPCAQGTQRDSIIQIIENLKSKGDFITYSNRSELNLLWQKATDLMLQLFNIKDSILIDYIEANYTFIENHKDPNIVITTHGTNGSTSFKNCYSRYKQTIKYIGLDSQLIFKGHIKDGYVDNGLDMILNFDINKLKSYINNLDSNEFYYFLIRFRQPDLAYPVNNISVWQEYKNTIISDSNLHIRFLYALSQTKPSGPGDSVLQLEVSRFNSLNPKTWNISRTLDYIQKTKNQPLHQSISQPSIDSSELERKKILQKNSNLVDSLIQKGNEGGADPKVLEILHQYKSNEDLLFSADAVIEVVIFDSLNAEEKRDYLVAADTTLWEPENKIYMYRGSLEDDGMRFDTFSNAELIQFIDTLSFSSIYPYDTSCRSVFCVNTAQIHLHKVCQILGDRRAYGAFSPDSMQQAVVDRFIDTLMEFGRIDTPKMISIQKRGECRELMIRLGRLGVPKFISQLTDPPYMRWTWINVPEEIFRQITEDEIIHMVARADSFLNQGDTARASSIATDMYIFVSQEVYVKPEQRRPRRPVAPTRERQRWADEYIWPLLLRMNHWYTRME